MLQVTSKPPQLCNRRRSCAHASANVLAAADISMCCAVFCLLQVTSMGYKDLVTFHSFDKRGKSVYHTNVMMAIGTDVAVVCGESVTDDQERQNLMVSTPCMGVVLWGLQQASDLCGSSS